MSTALANLHKCSIGSADFQLEDFAEDNDAVVKDGRQTGRRLTIRGTGWVEAESGDWGDLVVRITEAVQSFSTSGKDVIIYGFANNPLRTIPAAMCLNGGPYVNFKILPGLGASSSSVTRRFAFEISAETLDLSGQPPAAPTYQAKVETAPDGLRVITWTGEISTVPGGVQDAFDQMGEQFGKAYPQPRWVLSYTFEQNLAGDKGKFTLVVNESAEDLPGVDDKTLAVDGSASFVTDRDEQMRLTRTWGYDLAVVGDPVALLGVIRPAGVPLLRESVQFGRYPHKRLQASFVTVTGGDGNALLNWTCRFQLEDAGKVYDRVEYPGLVPIYVARPLSDPTLRISGAAIGAQTWIDPPTLPADWPLLEKPRRTREVLNAVEYRVEWDYLVGLPPDSKTTYASRLVLLFRPKDVKPLPEAVDPGKVPTGPKGTPR
jgi:hypothetical protein